MHKRLLRLAMASIMLLMIVTPLCNMFDKWDKGPELPLVGHDTETTLMMTALEVGLGVAVAWNTVFLLDWLVSVVLPAMMETAPVHARRGVRAAAYLLLLFSPPGRIVTLRI